MSKQNQNLTSFNTAHQVSATASDVATHIDQWLHTYDRGNKTHDNGKLSFSQDEAAQNIVNQDGYVWKDQNGNGKVEISYAFLDRLPAHLPADKLRDFSEFTSNQKDQAKRSLQSWEDVANIAFTEGVKGSVEAHLTFGNVSSIGSAFAYYPNTTTHETSSWYGASAKNTTNTDVALNNYGRLTLTHEIGHMLGLSHPGRYNGDGLAYGTHALYAEDTRAYSVMSYWSEFHTGHNFTQGNQQAYASAPLMDDIAAIQQLYGANWDTRADDTVYGFHSNTGRDFLSANSAADKLVFSVWDGGGKDTFDFSGFTQDQRINLNAASFSDVGGMKGNVSIARGVTIENAFGGSGNDLLVGNEVDNILMGREGNDTLFGGAGNDTLWGGEGDDILVGGLGIDRLTGGEGRDTFTFLTREDSTPAGADVITDFVSGVDRIDVSQLSTLSELTFVERFTGKAGEAILTSRGNGGTSLEIDFDGLGQADFAVRVVGSVAATDIVL